MSNIRQLVSGIQTAQEDGFDSLLKGNFNFNADAWHVMNERDNQLIADSVLHGETNGAYVYNFKISGAPVVGVSVIGARALAAEYGGIKVRIVSSIDKTGSLLIFKSFEPIHLQAQVIEQLEAERDFYEVVLEIEDVKKGNSIQVRKKEYKIEFKSNGDSYSRPHFDVIAESKAYRNGLLALLPQDVVQKFKQKALNAGQGSDEITKTQLIERLMRYGAKLGVGINRKAVNELTYSEIMGIGEAAKAGKDQLLDAVKALNVYSQTIEKPEDEPQAPVDLAPDQWLNSETGEILTGAEAVDALCELALKDPKQSGQLMATAKGIANAAGAKDKAMKESLIAAIEDTQKSLKGTK